MALQAVVYQGSLLSHKNDPNKDVYTLLDTCSCDFNLPKLPHPWELEESPIMVPSLSNDHLPTESSSSNPKRRRRRPTRRSKNKEEIESQRMTHIAVERNRRKQMNDYLSTLKSLMPHSYAQRGDQASIVGGAINFVKELEQNLHSMTTQNTPFAHFFRFPQYSTMADSGVAAIADVEVSIVEGHANLKIRSIKHPKQLLKLVIGLQTLNLTILHLNVNTMEQFCLYSFNLKVEDESKLSSAEEVATAVHQLMIKIQQELIN